MQSVNQKQKVLQIHKLFQIQKISTMYNVDIVKVFSNFKEYFIKRILNTWI